MLDKLNVWLYAPATNYDILSLFIFITSVFLFCIMAYFGNKDRFIHLDTLFLLHNAAFNNHLRNYHGVDIGGGDYNDSNE